jgi:pyruvate/2-oxoglutarate dehydrogenase complex dihydrolipoamide dehydrogenase (E3) component
MAEPVRVEPMDRHNETLVANLHPPGWVNPIPTGRYNLVVIGAGTAGLVTAAGAAGLGAKVALIERHLFGGDCLNVGCVPSKCLIRSARAAGNAKRAADYGIRLTGEVVPDFPAVMERVRALRSRISPHDSVERFRNLGVDVYLGEGCFAGQDKVEVEGQQLTFRKAVIATGARAVQPPVEGLDRAGFVTNETVFSLTERPRRLAVFGAGPLGCEMAQAFRRLGSEVWLIERGGQLLSREDPEAAQIVAEAFRRDGVRLLLKTEVRSVSASPEGKVLRTLADGKEDQITVDQILIGAGRAPNVEGLNLEAAGVEYDSREGVRVNDFLQTTNRNIFAAGDICLKHKFTHTADATARIVIRNALFGGHQRLSALTIPWCTYTDPEIAHVGLHDRGARERGIAVDTFMRRFEDVDRAVCDGEEAGLIKVHVRKGTDRILGATIVAAHAGEMISELTLAITAGIGLGKISAVIHPYPTQAEAIRQAADAYNRTRLTPRVKALFSKWLAWRR